MSPHRLMSWPLFATTFAVLVASLNVPAKAEEALIIELTADRVERGGYLVTAVIECAGCLQRRENCLSQCTRISPSPSEL